MQLDTTLSALSKSKFRSSFIITEKDLQYIEEKGLEKIEEHAYDFIIKRLASSSIPNDGKQTPTKGHPVFIAQHATATCCRGCLNKWHHIPLNTELTEEEIKYIVQIIMTWIKKQVDLCR